MFQKEQSAEVASYTHFCDCHGLCWLCFFVNETVAKALKALCYLSFVNETVAKAWLMVIFKPVEMHFHI